MSFLMLWADPVIHPGPANDCGSLCCVGFLGLLVWAVLSALFGRR